MVWMEDGSAVKEHGGGAIVREREREKERE